MKKENCIVAQSGGPTAAINASLAGVIDGVKKSGSFTRIYGSLHGITGVLENNLMDMSLMALSHFPMLNTLELTPAMYLGSCRYKRRVQSQAWWKLHIWQQSQSPGYGRLHIDRFNRLWYTDDPDIRMNTELQHFSILVEMILWIRL